MNKNTTLEQLIEIVGSESILNLLKDAGKKAGEAKDWQQVAKISSFIEAFHSQHQ